MAQSSGPSGQEAPPGLAEPRRALAVRALGVLRRWDAQRASAYAAGDPALLRGLYTRRSEAGRRDRDLLARYAERGAVVRGVVPQIRRVEVTSADPRRLRVKVEERYPALLVVGTTPTDADEERVGERRYRDRVVVLRRTPDGWRVASVGRA